MALLEVKNLSKSFNRRIKTWNKFRDLFVPKQEKFHVLKNISFNVETWEKVAFIWPNGAGKSTTIKSILWILHYDSWKIKLFGKDPIRDYRFDDMDAHHDVMFQQMEWIYIDKNVSIANFKECMLTLLQAVIWREIELRFRPCFFPFVEPGFEIDARYDIIDAKTWNTTKSDWMEILWAWMMHPNVLKEWGINPEIYTWFAFGIWISRLAAVRYWIKDIRYFTNWDLRFAKSF